MLARAAERLSLWSESWEEKLNARIRLVEQKLQADGLATTHRPECGC